MASRLSAQSPASDIERWDRFELQLAGPRDGNPFLDVQVSAEFRQQHRSVVVDGFYDGGGAYKVRFSPDAEGEWSYFTHSNRPELDGQTGTFRCVAPSGGNHGPVSVRNTYDFGYADGKPYFPFGTTCYAWTHQPAALQEQTIETLRQAPFNKMRMCVFPKWYTYNRDEPPVYPFPRSAQGENDYTRFVPEFFHNLEARIAQLQSLGIEADLILFHPYDHWGYALMPPEVDDRYLRYIVARLAAFRNVWWSVANEWDFVKGKTLADWDRYFRILQESDPYSRLRSIHHSGPMYDPLKPWVTHVSIQGRRFRQNSRVAFHLPQASGLRRVQVRRQHSQALGRYLRPRDDAPLLARDGVRCLRGTRRDVSRCSRCSVVVQGRRAAWREPARIAFLRGIIESGPAGGTAPVAGAYYPCIARAGEDYLYFLDYHQPTLADFELPAGAASPPRSSTRGR